MFFAQDQIGVLSKLFQGVPIEKSYNDIVSYTDSNSNFKRNDNTDYLLQGINGKDFFIGSVINLDNNEILNSKVESNSFSVVKAVNYSINSIVFRDTLEIVSISLFYSKENCKSFKKEFKKLNKLFKDYSQISSYKKFEDSDQIKSQYYFYSGKNEKLPFITIEKQVKGYSKSQKWYILSVSHYR
jgi:hypothetical protein